MYLYVQYELLVSTNRCIFLSIIIPSFLPVLSGMAIKLSELRHLSVRSQEHWWSVPMRVFYISPDRSDTMPWPQCRSCSSLIIIPLHYGG